MTNTLNKIMHNGDEYNFPDTTYTAGSGISIDQNNEISNSAQFSPTSSGSQWQVLTKWASGYDWANPSGWSSTITVTLASANWSSKEITVSATWVTASNTVIVSPAPADINDYASNSVYCSAQWSGTLTFSCNTEPTSDIDVNVLILN